MGCLEGLRGCPRLPVARVAALLGVPPRLPAAVSCLRCTSQPFPPFLSSLHSAPPPLVPPRCRHLPVNKAAWQDVKGAMVLAGTYEEAVKMMGDMNFLQVLQAAAAAGQLR